MKYHFVKVVVFEYLLINRLDFVSCFLHTPKSKGFYLKENSVDLTWKYKPFFPFDSWVLKGFSCEIHILLLVKYNDPSP